jgi:hypothetical protein
MSYEGVPVANGQALGPLFESLIRVAFYLVESNSQEERNPEYCLAGHAAN